MDEDFNASVRIKDFELSGVVGSGGMGVVHRARRVSDGRPVALKMLGPRITDPRLKARFKLEAEILSKMDHDGIIRFIEQFDQGGESYIATELAEGVNFRELMAALSIEGADETDLERVIDGAILEKTTGKEASDWDQTDLFAGYETDEVKDGKHRRQSSITAKKSYVFMICKIIIDVAQALGHAHQQGIWHLDIKPENLMVDNNYKVKVIDFGVAKYREFTFYTSNAFGTPDYMSPEQLQREDGLDHRSDLFSLGVVFYELLANEHPFKTPYSQNRPARIMNKSAPPLRWRNPSVSLRLESVVHKLIAKDPDVRYGTASEFIEDLHRATSGKRVVAKPYRFRIDETEINKRRPSVMGYVGFLYGMFAFILIAFLVSINVELLIRGTVFFYNVNSLGTLTLNLLFFGVATVAVLATMGAWKGFMLFNTISSLFNLGMITLFAMFIYNTSGRAEITVTAGILIMTTMNAFCLISCIAPASTRWCRFAKELRLEHREVKRTKGKASIDRSGLSFSL